MLSPRRFGALYLGLVVLPVVLTVTSVAWYPLIGPDSGFLLAGWALWSIASVSALILGSVFDIDLRDSSASPVESWNKLSAALLTSTGIVGLLLSMFSAVAGSVLKGGIGL